MPIAQSPGVEEKASTLLTNYPRSIQQSAYRKGTSPLSRTTRFYLRFTPVVALRSLRDLSQPIPQNFDEGNPKSSFVKFTKNAKNFPFTQNNLNGVQHPLPFGVFLII
jgi:hypothetical protein